MDNPGGVASRGGLWFLTGVGTRVWKLLLFDWAELSGCELNSEETPWIC